MRVYISGPITGVADARKHFANAEAKLRSEGVTEIVNPEALLRGFRMTHEEYLHVCTALLEVSDVMVLLPGWRESKGACLELGVAMANKIRVYELYQTVYHTNRLKELEF